MCCAGCLKIWQAISLIHFDFKLWAAKEGLREDAGDHIVATGKVTMNYYPIADKAMSQTLLDVSSYLQIVQP